MILVPENQFSSWISSKLLCESPGGNLVDGLPPAAHTGAGRIGRNVGR